MLRRHDVAHDATRDVARDAVHDAARDAMRDGPSHTRCCATSPGQPFFTALSLVNLSCPYLRAIWLRKKAGDFQAGGARASALSEHYVRT